MTAAPVGRAALAGVRGTEGDRGRALEASRGRVFVAVDVRLTTPWRPLPAEGLRWSDVVVDLTREALPQVPCAYELPDGAFSIDPALLGERIEKHGFGRERLDRTLLYCLPASANGLALALGVEHNAEAGLGDSVADVPEADLLRGIEPPRGSAGALVHGTDYAVRVLKALRKQKVGGSVLQVTAAGEYVLLRASMANYTDKRFGPFMPGDLSLADAAGRVYAMDTGATAVAAGKGDVLASDVYVPANGTAEFIAVFEVSKDARGLVLVMAPKIGSAPDRGWRAADVTIDLGI